MLLLPILALFHVTQATPTPPKVAGVISVRSYRRPGFGLPAPRGARFTSPHSPSRYSLRRREPLDIQNVHKGLAARDGPKLDGTITIGTPPQALSCVFDISSSELVIPTGGDSTSSGVFNTASSSTFSSSQAPFESHSTTGGVIGYDTVTIGGIKLEQQAFAAVPASELERCVIGVATGLPSQTNLLDNLLASDRLASNVLAYSASSGELCLGCIDSTKYTGDITYHPIDTSDEDGEGTESRAWKIRSKGFAVDGTLVTSKFAVTVDDGTRYITAPEKVAADLHAALPGFNAVDTIDGYWEYQAPCDVFHTLPSVGIVFGDKTYVIPGDSLNAGEIEGTTPQLCASAIGGIPGDKVVRVGNTFTKSFYAVFDLENSRVGFAKST